MKQMKFTTTIKANREQVWQTLWQDNTFRQWAGLIDPGTYMKGQLVEGNQVEFISAENGYGVTSIVDTLIPNQELLLKHKADTQQAGAEQRANEWTGGSERYTLSEDNGVTTLSAEFDVPEEMEDYFSINYPKALDKVKTLSEA
jgi:hypothetical protein